MEDTPVSDSLTRVCPFVHGQQLTTNGYGPKKASQQVITPNKEPVRTPGSQNNLCPSSS